MIRSQFVKGMEKPFPPKAEGVKAAEGVWEISRNV